MCLIFEVSSLTDCQFLSLSSPTYPPPRRCTNTSSVIVSPQAKAQVNRKAQISDLRPSDTPQPILILLQIYHYVPWGGSRCAKFGWNPSRRSDAAHARKISFSCGFLWTTYLSLSPFLFQGYRSQFWGSNNAFLQPLVPFGGLNDITVH